MLTLNQRKELLRQLPDTLREAIDSIENIEKVEAIGKDNRLLLDQIVELDNVITETILGVVRTDDFVEEIRKRVGVDFETAERLRVSVDEEIFHPIKEFLVNRPSIPEPKTVVPEEEDESQISRESLLQEIENPTRSTFKTALVFPPSIAETHNTKVLGAAPSVNIEMPAEHFESLPAPIDPSHEIAAPRTSIPTPEIAPMEQPKSPPTLSPLATEPPLASTLAVPPVVTPITQATRTVTEIKPTQPEKRRTIDPYREPIE